ncbi:Uma2 family endonuclease [Streptomyces albireticuli]|uniref:Uma2 family endonuclease n=1 Tax=Streptomyces albireticuli TaxID=1940 RepID=UPI0036A284D7
MTTTAHEPTAGRYDFLPELFLELDKHAPEGLRAELIEGEIIVSSLPVGSHEHCLSEIFIQVARRSVTSVSGSGHKGLILPSQEPFPPNHIIPDATFTPRDTRLFRGAPPWMPSAGVSMVVEVTGIAPDRDRIAKRHCYARAAIPLYLLVDREQGTVTLHSDPVGEDYEDAHSTAFGKALPLPAPFSFDLDTSEFA